MTTALSAAAVTRLGKDPRLQRASPRDEPSPDPPEDEDARQHREYDAQHLEGVGGDVEHATFRQALVTPAASCCTTSHAVRSSRGTADTRA